MSIKPNKLKKGDTVGIIAPAGHPKEEILKRCLDFFLGLGLQVKFGSHINSEYGYLAGKDKERLSDLHEMFKDKEVKAIFCARGGYGTARIASKIDFNIIRENPKIFWGFSDITYLLIALFKCADLVTFHGPMLSQDILNEGAGQFSKMSFHQLFEDLKIVYSEKISPMDVMIEGKAQGILVGGNLSLLTSTLGTPFEIDTKDKILFFEDIGEEPYRVDRMLNQLLCAGKLSDAAGILVCDFNDCNPKGENPSITLSDVISHYISLAGKPALSGLRIGHCSPNIAVPIGVMAKMDTNEKRIIIDCGVSKGE